MLKTPIARGVALATLGATLAIPTMAQAAFFEDSKASLELRNFYHNSDNHVVAAPTAANPRGGQSKSEEWAQGFIFKYESGFTEGTVGFGIDAIGLLGLKLDSSADRVGTGLLPGAYADDESAPDDYGRIGGAAKARYSKTTLKIGEMIPKLPTILPSDSRLLPQTFRGGMLTSQEIDGLTVNVGRMTETSLRSEAGFADLGMSNAGDDGEASDKFDFASLKYQWNKQLTTSYDYGNLDKNYKQHILNLVHVLPLGEKQSFKSDIRYAHSTEDGNSNVDNKAFGAMFTYSLGGHAFGAAYQDMSGDTGYPYIAGGDAFLVNYVMVDPTFADPDEKSWQLRYDYNFAAMGVPGLTFMTRYVKGTDAGADGNGSEWERDTDIGYVMQSGALKNLGVKLRNGTYRGEGREIDQTRFIVSYTIPLM
ncbi:OprD family porin [Pseudomonas stutzeri]|uniref:OprD family porin n=1 Tax=Stutzerimonas stutzeri TaxID=316 RepID=UPI00210EFFF7|nr:OprD family porin [Stutzerimonas stutzeri]MCQ4313373.1 OprD family porin [Stutzerimonas stutzeri]